MKKLPKDPLDRRLALAAILLYVASACILAYDVITIFRGTVNANEHMPFVPSIGLAAFGTIILVLLKSVPISQRQAKPSYSHLRQWHRSRIDAPDGTSD